MFHVPENTGLFRLQRLQFANDMPISYTLSYLSSAHMPDLEQFMPFGQGLYHVFDTHCRFRFTRVAEQFSAEAANLIEAQMLEVANGLPLFVSKRCCYNAKDRLGHTIAKTVGSQYTYSTGFTAPGQLYGFCQRENQPDLHRWKQPKNI